MTATTKRNQYSSEEQVTKAIDRIHALSVKDEQSIIMHECHIEESKRIAAAAGSGYADGVNYRRAMILTLKKRIKSRDAKLATLKGALAEFQTLPLPLAM